MMLRMARKGDQDQVYRDGTEDGRLWLIQPGRGFSVAMMGEAFKAAEVYLCGREAAANGVYGDNRAIYRPLHLAGFLDMVAVLAENVGAGVYR